MKTFIIGLIVLGLTNLMYAQNEIVEVTFNTNSNFESIYSSNIKSIKTIKNVNYASAFTDKDLSKKIMTLQNFVANYDIKAENCYTPNLPCTYKVVFKDYNNKIVAIYNHDGKVVSSKSKFNDSRLPFAISKDLSKTYPGWGFSKIQSSIDYSKDAVTDVTYKVLLRKGNQKKRVRINAADYSI